MPSTSTEHPLLFDAGVGNTILDFDVVPSEREALVLIATETEAKLVIILKLDNNVLSEEDLIEVSPEAVSIIALTQDHFIVEGERQFSLHRSYEAIPTKQLREGLVAKLSQSPVVSPPQD